MLRKDKLCPGGPKDCHSAKLVACQSCGHEYQPADIRAPSNTPCPECGKGERYVRLPCEDCGEIRLEQELSRSSFSPLINRAIELDALLNLPGAAITLDDMTAEEFSLVQLITSERQRYNSSKDNAPPTAK